MSRPFVRTLTIDVTINSPLANTQTKIRRLNSAKQLRILCDCRGSFCCTGTARDGDLFATAVMAKRYPAGTGPDSTPPSGAMVGVLDGFDFRFRLESDGTCHEVSDAEGHNAPGPNNDNRVAVWASFDSLITPANPQGWAPPVYVDFIGLCDNATECDP